MTLQTNRKTLRVLVVDDNRDIAESTAIGLRLNGYDVDVAFDGPAALEAARRTSPHAVFLDISMPGMDGYQVARKLREMYSGSHRIWLVAVTALNLDADNERCKTAGFDMKLTKPADLRDMDGILRALQNLA